MNGFSFRLASILLLLTSIGIAKAQTWISFDSQKDEKNISTEIIQSDETEYKVKVLIHGLSDKLVNSERGEFHHISIGGNNYLSNIGEPSLPLFSQLIAIPAGGRISAEIIDEQWTNVEMGRIYPAQKPLLETEKADGFDFAEEVYQNSYLPPLLNIGQTMQWRNIKNANVSVCPFKYDPQENRLSVMKQFVLHVTFKYDAAKNARPYSKADDPYCLFDNISHTDDGQLLGQDDSESVRSNMNSDHYNYLIVIGNISGIDSNNAKLKEFCRWKAQKGYKTNVIYISGIGNDKNLLKDSIYQELHKGLQYVLFVGDNNSIPLADITTQWHRTVLSDYWYGCLVGDDVEAEIPIGRFSVETDTQFENIVDKTIKYERNYDSSNEVLLVAHAEGSPGWFQGCCQQISSLHNQQMSFKKAYGAGVPYGYNATNANVVDSINNGAHIVNYRGHGAPTFWGSFVDGSYQWNSSGEAFTNSEINNMNDETCAVFFSVACQTGRIADNICMLEAFTRSDYGAVAFIGATEDTEHYANDGYDKLLFEKLLDNNVYHLGDLNISAHIANSFNYGDSYKDNPFCYLCGGDPSLEIWTSTPQKMYVNWNFENGNATITTGFYSGGYYITIVSEETGERLDSIACSGYSCTFPIPSNCSKFFITVNKHNYFPYIIYYNSEDDGIFDTAFDYDAYYTTTPMFISTNSTQFNDKVIVKNGHRLVIKNGNGGVEIDENFECEKGARFEIK